jgi:hypothetical protein
VKVIGFVVFSKRFLYIMFGGAFDLVPISIEGEEFVDATRFEFAGDEAGDASFSACLFPYSEFLDMGIHFTR